MKILMYIILGVLLYKPIFADDVIPRNSLYVLACGTVEVTTNSAPPGRLGAPVVQKWLQTDTLRLRLLTVGGIGAYTDLKAGDRVAIYGFLPTNSESNAINNVQTNQDGSVDMTIVGIITSQVSAVCQEAVHL